MTANTGPSPDVSLIVVNYQGEAHVRACLESLVAEPGATFEIFVVDNASSDASPDVIRAFVQDHAHAELIASPENLGYAGAVNLVLDRCAGRFIGVLNMDLVAEPGWLAPLAAHLDAHENVAAVNPLLLLQDGNTVNATGMDLHISGLAFNRSLGRPRSEIDSAPFEIPGLQGAAFLCRRDVLLRLGGLDESGFLYHEDVRLSWALHSLGFEMACVPTSVLCHDYTLSMHPEKLFLLERNRLDLLLVAFSPISLVLISPLLLLTDLMLMGYSLLRGPRFLIAKGRVYLDLARSRAARRVRRRAWITRRQRGDLALLQHLTFRYAWRQFFTLAREKGPPRRSFASR